MTEPPDLNFIDIDAIDRLLREHGYVTSVQGQNFLRVEDVESHITIEAVLTESILFMSVTCATMNEDDVRPRLLRRMLAADNGIEHSSFKLSSTEDGSVTISLTNFCKLQTLGPEDSDDLLSCLEFLVIDVCAAKVLLDRE